MGMEGETENQIIFYLGHFSKKKMQNGGRSEFC